MKPTVHLILLVEETIVLFQNTATSIYDIPNAEVQSIDGHANTFAASKLINSLFPDLDIRSLTLNDHKDFTQVINWEQYHKCDQHWKQTSVKELNLVRNPNFYIWAHFFNQAPIWNDDEDLHRFYFIQITHQDLQHLQEASLNHRLELNSLHSLKPKTKKILDKNSIFKVIKEKKFSIITKTIIYLNLKEGDSGRFCPPRPFLDTVSLFNGVYRRKQEQWLTYQPPLGNFPSNEVLAKASAILIPGSNSSCYESKEWIQELEHFIRVTYQNFPTIKLLGICFGCQILAKAFGGKVEPLEGRRRDKGFHIFGTETLHMQIDELSAFPEFKGLKLKAQMQINKAHGDYVTIVPENFKNVGHSQTAPNEVLISQDRRILALQSHPEFSTDFQLLQLSQNTSWKDDIDFESVYSSSEFKQNWTQQEDPLGRKMCMAFLKK